MSAIRRSRATASALRPECGVELSRPNAPWAAARADSSESPGVQLAQRVDPDLDVTPLELAHRVARALGEVGEIAVLHDDQLRLALRELGLELDQRDEHLLRVAARRRALLAAGEEVLADADQHLGEQGVLALEVPVERGPAHPDRRAEVGDAHPVVAVLGEELRRRPPGSGRASPCRVRPWVSPLVQGAPVRSAPPQSRIVTLVA